MANKCINCNNCSHIGWSKNRGNFLITIILAIFFFIPAIIYEIWRRIGLGVCENCGSNQVRPSSLCKSSKPSNVGDLIFLGVIGVIGAVVIMALYAFADTIINGGPSNQKTIRDQETACIAKGLKHYQQLGQYPVLSNGVETSMYLMKVCKNSKDGTFKAP
ncbi:Pmp3 family protein [Acinetobacter wuhouensis]|uniref:Pmp3 family protein n=1 Tax=Acinetobacter wuhouensis TaxID=1879050 RepID=UPI001023214B|nr:Pmp3 family protein [Acinetobacter wuhouensis]RZG71912.1 Pmp3 family protein [Acinetobacter wuhouensis]